MSFTHRIRAASFSGPGESLGGASTTVVGDVAGTPVSVVIPAGSTNYSVLAAFDGSAMKSLYMIASGDLTIDVVSAVSPNPVIELLANRPFYWIQAERESNPFGASDVTGFLVDNADPSVDVTLEIRSLADGTPA